MSLSWASILLVSTSSTSSVSADLLAEFTEALETPTSADAKPSVRLIDLSLDILGAGGTTTGDESILRMLQAGGHDPKNRGFTVQNVELTLSGVVDPYLRGDAHVIFQISEEGESIIELEEAYLTTLDLPANLQLKAGQFFSAFGRLNPTHPHTWDFIDQAVVNTRFLGPDGLRNPGVQISWLTPLPFFFELLCSVQNSHGETAVSFRSAEGEEFAGRTLIARDVRSGFDLLYLLRARGSFDLSDATTVILGASGVTGPNAAATDTRTWIGGADLYVKWKPLDNDKGWPFLALQAEGMVRRYELGDADLFDDGLYAQLIWGFSRPFVLGLRYDYARGEDFEFDEYRSSEDFLRDTRHRGAASLTYYPTEFSKIRLQYSHDHASFLPDDGAHSIYLQAEINFGAHGAHQF